MQVQLLVERDQNECIVNLAGTAYKFKRNEHGHLVSDITDQDHIKWVSDPFHNTAFKVYSVLKKIIEEVVDDACWTRPKLSRRCREPHVGPFRERDAGA